VQEPPESAPAGTRVARPPDGEVPDDTILFISELSHALQVTEEISEEERILSKIFPHLLQENR
jgi:hypothetical protein